MTITLQTVKENPHQTFALVTIIGVIGSAYRREGAKMLISGDGQLYGMVSSGCLEEDLRAHAEDTLKSNQTKIVMYDLRHEDDLSWGRGIGCNGSIKTLVEPIKWDASWTQVDQWLQQGKSVVSITPLHGDMARPRVFWTDEEQLCLGDIDGSLLALKPETETLIERGIKLDLLGDVLFEVYHPKDPLYIFGAGVDVEPLVCLLSSLHFEITLIDPRENRCNVTHFPKANRHVVQHPVTFLDEYSLSERSYVIVMTHSFEWDQQIIQRLFHVPLGYVGVLGPRQRTTRLLSGKLIPSWLHTPIGLPLQAEGAEEISVSIAAELLKIRNHRRKSRSGRSSSV
ncbi:hypothetical protein BEP19_03955 [Ammoniphilus oxalaticus]|uniref:Xanthine dehydrogenase n=1 Tax=Ammoniphilus oxalaticus TaxID=66863 RepID=A0A419SMB2_9BACL|nr:XdhC family protein [Ammoniphilus oxalaticus]RKD25146.1 hypothetical protein BEP19_03955 [Ammoniphilus oxalaticus]